LFTSPRPQTLCGLRLFAAIASVAFASPLTAQQAAPGQSPLTTHLEALALAEHPVCGAEVTSEVAAHLFESATGGHRSLPPDLEGVTFHIPISMHVVRRSNGTGGLNANTLANTLRDANQLFESAGIHFCEVGETIFIDDDQFFSCICDGSGGQLRGTARVQDSLNAYFVPNLRSSSGPLCGLGTLPGYGNSGIIMRNSCTALFGNRSTTAHELGHFLGLMHTHDRAYGVECADGSNCDIAGDLICDTSADPNLLGRVNNQCNFIGPYTGHCSGDGATLNPPVHNIMSYARASCRNTFTPGQIQRLREVIIFDRPEIARFECVDDDIPRSRTLLRISETEAGEPANAQSGSPAVASKGRFVAFVSRATNLVPGVDSGLDQIYLRDLELGTLEHISRTRTGEPSDSINRHPKLSADGRYVVYSSSARNLVPEVPGPSSAGNVYRFDRLLGEHTLVSRAPGGGGGDTFETNQLDVSSDGRFVTFSSRATNFALIEGFPLVRIYLADVQMGTVKLISMNEAGDPANNHSRQPAISPDGRFVAFESNANNLDPADPDGFADIYVFDSVDNTTRLISIDEDGEKGFGQARTPSFSRNNRYVAFELAANGPWDDDRTTIFGDIAVKDLQTGLLLRASETPQGIPSEFDSDAPVISARGRYVAFRSRANEFNSPPSPLADFDVWLKDMVTGAIQPISMGSNQDSFGPALDEIAMDARARLIAFTSEASNLVPGDTNREADVFVRILPRD